MLKKLRIKEGDNTNIKVFVAHDHDVVDFNSLEDAEDLEEIDCLIQVSSIQAGDTVAVGFFLRSCITMNAGHWTRLINEHSKLNRVDVEVIIQNIET